MRQYIILCDKPSRTEWEYVCVFNKILDNIITDEPAARDGLYVTKLKQDSRLLLYTQPGTI